MPTVNPSCVQPLLHELFNEIKEKNDIKTKIKEILNTQKTFVLVVFGKTK